jgi:hypothetical protein
MILCIPSRETSYPLCSKPGSFLLPKQLPAPWFALVPAASLGLRQFHNGAYDGKDTSYDHADLTGNCLKSAVKGITQGIVSF